MRILGIDFETTGIDLKKDLPTELAAVLWDIEAKEPLEIYSVFVLRPDRSAPAIPKEVIDINGITTEKVKEFGDNHANIKDRMHTMASRAQFFMAHNAEFDRAFFEREFFVASHKWIDTMIDVPYPKKIKTRHLPHLAAEHGFINPFAHRALFDVLTMLKVASCYDFNEILRLTNSPTITIRADVNYSERDLARGRGFYWNPEQKIWYKRIKSLNLNEEKMAPFGVSVIG